MKRLPSKLDDTIASIIKDVIEHPHTLVGATDVTLFIKESELEEILRNRLEELSR